MGIRERITDKTGRKLLTGVFGAVILFVGYVAIGWTGTPEQVEPTARKATDETVRVLDNRVIDPNGQERVFDPAL